MPAIIDQVRHLVPEPLAVLRRFIRDEGGQDLIEYAFLAAFIGIAGYVVLGDIVPVIGVTYTSWMSPTTGVSSLWQPAEPWTSGS